MGKLARINAERKKNGLPVYDGKQQKAENSHSLIMSDKAKVVADVINETAHRQSLEYGSGRRVCAGVARVAFLAQLGASCLKKR
jgi:hypothetical protein